MKILPPILYADSRAVQSRPFERQQHPVTPELYLATQIHQNPAVAALALGQMHKGLVTATEEGFTYDPVPLVLTNESFSDSISLLPSVEAERDRLRQLHENHGQSGMLAKTRRHLNRLICAVQLVYGKDRLTFFTGTLDEQMAKAIQGDKVAEMTENFKRIVTRAQKAAGLDPVFVGAIEIQPKRHKRTGVIAYHWHCVILNAHTPHNYVFRREQWVPMWNEALALTTSRPRGFSQEGEPDFKAVKHDAAMYLAGYIAKGEETVAAIKAADPNYRFPKRWWTATNFVRDIEKSMQLRLDPLKFQSFLEDVKRVMPEQIVYEQEVEVPVMKWLGGYGYTDSEEWECNLLNVGYVIQFRDYFTVASYAINNGYAYVDDIVNAEPTYSPLLQDTRQLRKDKL